jgi:predicted RNase H-like nuclease
MDEFIVAGVDGCRAGWFVAIVGVKREGLSFETRRIFVAKDFVEVISRTNDCEIVCVDIPIGLSDGDKPRACDKEARKILGNPRASSVFPAPIRPCLPYKQYRGASVISRKLGGKGLTKQSFAILEKIRQVDCVMTPELQKRIREIHPEVCFWALNGKRSVREGKRSAAGQAKRRQLLEQALKDIDVILQKADMKGYAMDDILDAFTAAWMAGQAVLNKVKTLPARPETDSNGLRMEMVYSAGDFRYE